MSERSYPVRPVRRHVAKAAAAVVLFCCITQSLRAAEIALVPVGSDGPHVIVGDEIRMPLGGQRVFFDIFISGWDADGDGTPRLKAYQASIDDAGFTSATHGTLVPALAACQQATDCTLAFGGACFLTGGQCTVDADCLAPGFGDLCAGPLCGFFVWGDPFCEPGFIASKRSDFVFADGASLGGVDLSQPGFRYGFAAQNETSTATDAGTPRYAGTLVLDVSSDAAGTFTLGLLAGSETLLLDQNNNMITPVDLMSARVTIPDCNDNGIADAIDISSGASDDCNENTIPDDCEPDCDGNGIQDDCDLRDCPPGNPPVCDDCNLNGVLDSCDIAALTSVDADLDGVPDECIVPLVAMGSWTDDIWGLAGGFPDDVVGTPDLSVTLNSGELLLDTTVVIDDLRLEQGAALNMTQIGDGDMILTAGGNVSVSGTLVLGDDNVLDAGGGSLAVGTGGFVGPAVVARRQTAASGVVSASILSGDVVISGGDCFSPPGGGEMALAGTMSLTVTGNLLITAPESLNCCGLGATNERALGITPPPKFGSDNGPSINVDGNFFVSGRGGVIFAGEVASSGIEQGRAAGVTTGGISLGGDFINDSKFPTLSDWSNGRLELRGTTPQTVEVGGIDLGRTFEGFATDADTFCETGSHSNYSIGTLELAGGSDVTLVNARANTVGTGACEEALYVRNLLARAGSTLTLDNVRLYVDNRDLEPGVTINKNGCGDILCLSVPLAPTTTTVAKNRYLSVRGEGAGGEQALRVVLSSLPDPFSVFNGLVMWVGEATDLSELGSKDDATPPTFKAATLQCDPFFADWGALGTVQVWHETIIPGGVYEVSAVNAGCDLVETSASLLVASALWGDVVAPFDPGTGVWPPPDGRVDVAFDVVAILDKFGNRPTAPKKARADIDPGTPDRKISIVDVTRTLDAFSGNAYPFFPGAAPCP